jgi:hypothetical protein
VFGILLHRWPKLKKGSTLLSLSCSVLVVHGIYSCRLITIKRCLRHEAVHVVLENTTRGFELEPCCLRFPIPPPLSPPLSLYLSPLSPSFSPFSLGTSVYFKHAEHRGTLSRCQRSRCIVDWLCNVVLTTQNVNDILLQTSLKSLDPHLQIFSILI